SSDADTKTSSLIGDQAARLQEGSMRVGPVVIGDTMFLSTAHTDGARSRHWWHSSRIPPARCQLGGSGGLPETVAPSASMTALKPKTVDFKTAASLPLVGASAIQAIVDHMNVQRGQRILVHDGVGGVVALPRHS